MDPQYSGVITLLRSALNNQHLQLPSNFDLDKGADLLYKHHMLGLGIQGAVLCGIPRSHPAIVNMTALFCAGLQQSRNQQKKLLEVFSLFESNGIMYMPMKGTVIQHLYSRPEYRVMGDADVLIRSEQYSTIRQILLSIGMKEMEDSDYEQTWKCPELTLELHRCLVTEDYTDFCDYYRDSWKFAKINIAGSRYDLSDEDHFVYLIVHFAKHYRRGTICAKDICDFYIWRKAHPNMDEQYIRSQMSTLKLSRFYQYILELLDNWFGDAPSTMITEMITKAVFQGGVYEDYNRSVVDDILRRRTEKNKHMLISKIKWFMSAVFPGFTNMAYVYPVLKKCPILLPAFWVVRWVNALFVDRDRLKRGVLVMQYDTDEHTQYLQHMNTVGLGDDQN